MIKFHPKQHGTREFSALLHFRHHYPLHSFGRLEKLDLGLSRQMFDVPGVLEDSKVYKWEQALCFRWRSAIDAPSRAT